MIAIRHRAECQHARRTQDGVDLLETPDLRVQDALIEYNVALVRRLARSDDDARKFVQEVGHHAIVARRCDRVVAVR